MNAMDVLHFLVDLMGTVVVGTAIICGVGFLTLVVLAVVAKPKVLTSEGAEDLLTRLNAVERERQYSVMVTAPDDSSAANWLIRDSKERRVA